MDPAAPARRGWSRWRRRTGLLGLGLLLCGVLLKGCYVPPVVLAAGVPALDITEFPPGAELVEVRAAPGITLRGVQMAPPPGAPVVLHLLESMASITNGSRPFGTISIGGDPESEAGQVRSLSQLMADGWPAESPDDKLRLQHRWLSRLTALGLGGLVLDYEGVGASDGARSPDTLRRDARAAWERAVALAGGDERRVILRGTSLGALAAATLLQDGARPGAVILIAPVRAETVAVNFASRTWSPALLFVAQWFVRDAVDVNLVEVLGRLDVPLLVVSTRDDFLLPPDEAALVASAVSRAGGTFLLRRSSHEGLSLSSRDVLAVELAFFDRVFPAVRPGRLDAVLRVAQDRNMDPQLLAPGTRGRERLEALLAQTALPAPELTLAAVLAGLSDAELGSVSDWLAWLPRERIGALAQPELDALLNLQDPSGRVDIACLGETAAAWSAVPRDAAQIVAAFVSTVRSAKPVSVEFVISFITGKVETPDCEAIALSEFQNSRRKLLKDRGLPPADADRLTLRVMLKAAGIPERVVTGAAGVSCVQVFEDGVWREFDLP